MKIPDKIRKFNIIEFLGNGNFGIVFEAYDPLLKADRAIKLIQVPEPDKFVEAVKEAQTLEGCRHKHIVDVKEVDVCAYEGVPCVYIAMEYLAKGSIQKHLDSRFISIQESLKIVSEALLGLEHAHNNNVLHRDIKPGNILLGDNGEAKLSDFGLALDYHIDPSDTMGYRPHQPLEVIDGNPMDRLSDIYAMGMTLFRLVNNLPNIEFKFTSIDEWRAAVKKNKYPERDYLPHIPRKVKTIINKSINNDPAKRYQSASEFRQSLERVIVPIDWSPLDENTWVGIGQNRDKYEIRKESKRNGWAIDYKKNGRRITDHCLKELSGDIVKTEFFKIICACHA
ncbi:serine/threonine-protein kinase [Hahella sp. NBU794]|uniref:serine/threonine-protein kinase n=1 Tax=Hahella sp. NBU794 TaxID=3422590 RepID=UPI003D6EDB4D